MASRYCLNESNRFVEVDGSDGNLQVTTFQQEEKKKATLTPERWAQLLHISEELNEAVKKLMKNQQTTALQIHLGGSGTCL
jgi:predicted transglutaminase-like cysteine proteinase